MQKLAPIEPYQRPKYTPSTSTEEYVSRVCTLMTYEECLQKVKHYDDFSKFAGAIACAFDVDHRVIGSIANLDFLSRPSKEHCENYIQWIVRESNYGNNIDEVLSYLFCKYDHNDEKYEYSPQEKDRIGTYFCKIICTFCESEAFTKDDIDKTITNYMQWLADRLWMDEKCFFENYEEFIPDIKKKLAKYYTV